MSRGFTLLELLTVIVIIGILAALAIPTYATYRARSFNSRVQSDLHSVVTAQEVAYSDRSAYADCSDAGCNDPTLPGVKLSEGVGGSCALFDGGDSFQCGFTHSNGDTIYYYTSASATFWDTPN